MSNRVIKLIDQDLVPRELKIGEKYTTSWANPGCVWILKGFLLTNQVELETPSTKKIINTTSDSLRYLEDNPKAIMAAIKRTRK